METKELISKFFQSGKIAVVGATVNKQKFGCAAFTELKKRGFTLYPVNPGRDAVEGEKCYNSLKSLPADVEDAVFVIQPGKAAAEAARLKETGIKRVWFQTGSESDEAIKLCKENGIPFITRKCVLMYAPPVTGFHKFHRGVWKVIGRL